LRNLGHLGAKRLYDALRQFGQAADFGENRENRFVLDAGGSSAETAIRHHIADFRLDGPAAAKSVMNLGAKARRVPLIRRRVLVSL